MSKKRGDSGIEISDELNAVIDRWTLAVLGQDANITLCDVCRCAMKKT
jgi:hypothetical protein